MGEYNKEQYKLQKLRGSIIENALK